MGETSRSAPALPAGKGATVATAAWEPGHEPAARVQSAIAAARQIADEPLRVLALMLPETAAYRGRARPSNAVRSANPGTGTRRSVDIASRDASLLVQ